jgi:hypothetical protein
MGSLESAIDETFLVDVRALPDEALQDDIARLTRAVNRLNAAFLTRLEVLDRRGAVAAEHGSTGAWLREQMNVSATVAGRSVRLARDLADVLPDTAASLATGDVSVSHCQVIAGPAPGPRRRRGPRRRPAPRRGCRHPHPARAARVRQPRPPRLPPRPARRRRDGRLRRTDPDRGQHPRWARRRPVIRRPDQPGDHHDRDPRRLRPHRR